MFHLIILIALILCTLRKLVLKLIRKATDKDINAINLLGENLHSNFTKTYHIKTEIDSLIAIVLVSEEQGVINGYLYALDLGDNIDLLSIYVDVESRLNHIGTKLMQNLLKKAQDHTITLEVAIDNMPAINMYKNLGFKTVATRKKYYDGKDAYIMKWGI